MVLTWQFFYAFLAQCSVCIKVDTSNKYWGKLWVWWIDWKHNFNWICMSTLCLEYTFQQDLRSKCNLSMALLAMFEYISWLCTSVCQVSTHVVIEVNFSEMFRNQGAGRFSFNLFKSFQRFRKRLFFLFDGLIF